MNTDSDNITPLSGQQNLGKHLVSSNIHIFFPRILSVFSNIFTFLFLQIFFRFSVSSNIFTFLISGESGNQPSRDGSQGGHGSRLLVRISSCKIFWENTGKYFKIQLWKYFAANEKSLEELLLVLVWPWKSTKHVDTVGTPVLLTWYIFMFMQP